MSAFRDYLTSHNAVPDPSFKESDESLFVLALLLLRLGFGRRLGETMLEDARNALPHEDPLAALLWAPDLQRPLKFVARFMCFFVTKPDRYVGEVNALKQYFIPGFSSEGARDKRIQLFTLANPSFAATPLGQEDWTSVESFFKQEWLYVSATAGR